MIPGIISRRQVEAGGPVLVVETNFDNALNAGFLTIDKPTGLAAGNRLFAVLCDSDTSPPNQTRWSPPNNEWRRVFSGGDVLSDSTIAIFEKLAGDDEPASYSFSHNDTIDNLQGFLFFSANYPRLIGHSEVTINSNSTDLEVANIPVHENNTLVVIAFVQDGGGGGDMSANNGFIIESEIDETGIQSGLATKVVDSDTGITTITSTRSDNFMSLPIKLGRANSSNDPGTHRYWSLLVNDNAGDNSFIHAQGIEFREFIGGADRTGEPQNISRVGNGISDSQFNSSTPSSLAFQNIPDVALKTGESSNYSDRVWLSAVNDTSGVYIGYDFGVGNAIGVQEVVYRSRYDGDFDRNAIDFTLQYSDNGTDWTTSNRFSFADFDGEPASYRVQTSWAVGRGGPEVVDMGVYIPTGRIANGVSVRAMEPYLVLGKIDTGVSVADMTIVAVIEP